MRGRFKGDIERIGLVNKRFFVGISLPRPLTYLGDNLVVFGEAPRVELGEDDNVIQSDVEYAAAAGDQVDISA